MKADVVEFLQDLKAVLEYHHSSGIEHYPGGSDIEAFFESRLPAPKIEQPSVTAVPSQPVSRTRTSQANSVHHSTGKVQKTFDKNAARATLSTINAEVRACTGCALSTARVCAVPGSGGQGAIRLLVVGDWLAVENPEHLPAGCLFGVEQDRMLGKMFDAIKLPHDQVFVTNVIKCGVSRSVQPKAEHVHTCLSYLDRQITAIRPEMIMVMGMVSTKAMLKRRESLSRLRGRIYPYNSADGQKIPLLPTYHPTFLLQNPEMKRATWYDLQILAKQLGLTPVR